MFVVNNYVTYYNVPLFELNLYILFFRWVPTYRCHIEQSKNFGPADYLNVTKQITDKGK